MSKDEAKVKTIKKSFGFLRLSRTPTIYSIFFYFITTSAIRLGVNSAVTKCCPRDQLLSVADNFTCAYYGDHKPELYPLRSQGVRDNDKSLSCDEPSILTAKNNAGIIIHGRYSCVDVSYDHELNKHFPIVFRCFDGSKVEGKINEVILHHEVTRFETLRMCCGKNQYFDLELRDCRMRREEVNVTHFLNFLSGHFDFVKIVPNPPTCEHAILDYIVNVTTDLRVLANGSIEIVLPTNDGPEKILAELKNTCLDPDPSKPDVMIVRACSSAEFCSKRSNTCVRKCCPEDEFYGKEGCEKKPSNFPPVYFHDFFKNVSTEMAFMNARNAPHNGLLIGMACKYGMYPREKKNSWHFTPERQIYFPMTEYYEHHEYCFDMIYGDPNHAEDIYAFLCRKGSQTVS